MAETPLLERYAATETEVEKACVSAGRKRDEILLLAVSKFQTAQAVLEVAAAGQKDFGENYAQEARAKREIANAAAPDLRWHFIGHIQSRKARDIAGQYALIHSVDSIRIAEALEKYHGEARQNILIEVNIGEEPQKSGVMPSDLTELALHIVGGLPRLNLRGLMCMPPVFDAGEAARPYFAKLRELRDNLEKEIGEKLPELSMGMSGDFPGAIAEGATIIRIGAGIFGPRPTRRPD